MSGRIDFTMGFKTHGVSVKRSSDKGFRVYVVGNFSGHSEISWQQRKIAKIDFDSFDSVMAKIGPVLEVDSQIKLRFDSTEDFHPDAWLGKIAILSDLQALKRELSNPNTAAQAAAKIQAHRQAETSVATPDQPQETQEDMLERLLGKKPETSVTAMDGVNNLIAKIVAPHVAKDADPEHLAMIKVIDATLSQYCRAVLHGQQFQALEALWRATEALVKDEASDEQNFFLVDIRQDELMAELQSGAQSFAQKLLQHVQSGEDEQDVLIIGNYSFSDSSEDRSLLAFFSGLAESCSALFLGAAGSTLIANTVFDEAKGWQAYLRGISTDKVVLAYPRYLQRLPYGDKRDPIATFDFEECAAVIPGVDELLWANPAFLCARALIRENAAEQFNFSDIPSFSFQEDGEQKLQPGTETLFIEAQVNALLSQGIATLIGFRQRQGVRLAALPTLSEHS